MALAAIPFRLTGWGPNTFVPQRLSQAPCHLGEVFFPGFGGFFAETDMGAKAAEFAAPAGPACSFVLWERLGWPENPIKSGPQALGPRFASGDPNSFHPGPLRASISDIPSGIFCERSSFADQEQLRPSQ
jgi:hypothetical protein